MHRPSASSPPPVSSPLPLPWLSLAACLPYSTCVSTPYDRVMLPRVWSSESTRRRIFGYSYSGISLPSSCCFRMLKTPNNQTMSPLMGRPNPSWQGQHEGVKRITHFSHPPVTPPVTRVETPGTNLNLVRTVHLDSAVQAPALCSARCSLACQPHALALLRPLSYLHDGSFHIQKPM